MVSATSIVKILFFINLCDAFIMPPPSYNIKSHHSIMKLNLIKNNTTLYKNVKMCFDIINISIIYDILRNYSKINYVPALLIYSYLLYNLIIFSVKMNLPE